MFNHVFPDKSRLEIENRDYPQRRIGEAPDHDNALTYEEVCKDRLLTNKTSRNDTRWYVTQNETITIAYLEIFRLNTWRIEDDYMNIYLLEKVDSR